MALMMHRSGKRGIVFRTTYGPACTRPYNAHQSVTLYKHFTNTENTTEECTMFKKLSLALMLVAVMVLGFASFAAAAPRGGAPRSDGG